MAEIKKQNLKIQKAQSQTKQTEKFKSQYYDYYDDIKSHTHKVTDW